MFPRLFQYVTTDAGFTSIRNALMILAMDKHYLFAVKKNQRALLKRAIAALAPVTDSIEETETYNGYTIVRHFRRARGTADEPFPGAVQVLHIHQIKTKRSTGEVSEEDRYYVTSIPWDHMSPERLMKLIRLHWGIENNANWTCDVIFEEDTHFPCRNGYGPHLLSYLLILAYNLVSIFRSLGHRVKHALPSFDSIIEMMTIMIFGCSKEHLFLEKV